MSDKCKKHIEKIVSLFFICYLKSEILSQLKIQYVTLLLVGTFGVKYKYFM